jgi:hypothetical protein
LIPVGEALLDPWIEGAPVGHFLDIGSGSKHLFSAGDDHHSDCIVSIELLHGQRQILD